MKVKDRPIISAPEQLPIALGTTDVMKLVRCCRPTALKLIKQGESEGAFRVVWIGEKRPEPRVNREAFISWLGQAS